MAYRNRFRNYNSVSWIIFAVSVLIASQTKVGSEIFGPMIEILSNASRHFLHRLSEPSGWTTNGVIITCFLGALPFLVLVVAIYRALQGLKGNLKIHLPVNRVFLAGDIIEGHLKVQINNSLITTRIEVELSAFNIIQNHGSKKRTIKDVHFQSRICLAEQTRFTARQAQSFQFKLELPQKIVKRSDLRTKEIEASVGESFGQSLVELQKALESKNRNMDWEITAHVEMPGIDLSEVVPVAVSMQAESSAT